MYKPYRILKKITIIGKDPASMREKYPNGRAIIRPGCVVMEYLPEQVVNRPSEQEGNVFDFMKESAREIPQDEEGFDSRTSGVARSVSTSLKAKKDALLEEAKEKHQRKLKSESKEDKDDE